MTNTRTGKMSRATGYKRSGLEPAMHTRAFVSASGKLKKTKTQRKLLKANKTIIAKHHAYMAGSGLLKKSLVKSAVSTVKNMFRRHQGK